MERVLLAAVDFIALVERSSCEINNFASIMHAIRMNPSSCHTQNSGNLLVSSIGSKRDNARVKISKEAMILAAKQPSPSSRPLH